jgi:PAS domain S-box-containing protein
MTEQLVSYAKVQEPFNMDLLEACCSSRRLWEETMLCMQHGIVVTDLEGNILFTSPAVEPMLRFTASELLDKNLSIAFMPEDLAYLYPNLLHLAQKNIPFEGELILVRKDGTHFIAFIVLRPFFNSVNGIIVMGIQDIDKRKHIEKAFKETPYEDMVKIADGIAHELRNPLLGIGGFLNRLFKLCKGLEEYQEYYDHIMHNLRKIETLVKKVEYFAHLPKPSLTNSSVMELIQKSVQPYLPKMEEQKIELVINVEEFTLWLDKNLVSRVFSVLLENALDALTEGGAISIGSKRTDNKFTISFSDTGAGISPKDLPFIFNPFFSTKPDGTGIDLAVVKRVMESHGGQVKVSSEQRRGATFSLEFLMEQRRPIRTSSLV